jgi:GT2 family glycosyltransferase
MTNQALTPTRPLLAVVIVNYQTPTLTIQAAESVLRWFHQIDYRLIIVDNQSNDRSWGLLETWHNMQNENVSLIESATNGGFSAGNNLGISTVDAQYYLLLNSDSIINSEDILQLFGHFKADASVGIVGPKLIDQDKNYHCSHFRFKTPQSELIDVAKTRLVDNFFKNKKVPLANELTTANFCPDWLSFACVMIRSEVIDQVGSLDEGFFMYFEDIEFCFRAKQAGWKLVYDDNIVATHLRGGSSPLKKKQANNKRLPKYYYESRARYFYKIGGSTNLVLANLGWSIGAIISILRSALGSSDHTLTQRAWIDVWANISRPLAAYTKPRR